ncbi:head morphogenesis [Escherichia phage EcS1]|uniref:Head assembly cochaperone with GroEL n=1 Tax=Escherichia phage EcS1 TaxID=2083276 RepID=A0A2Z5ZC95_9CAUD|nr:head morphogenesis [Escherichia phage EcS1]BBC78278.1 Head assembly cochaperone with GroEL [Escherichia phage EcS1]
MELPIKALGEHIIFVSEPSQAGDDKTSESGIFLGKETQGQLPEVMEVHSIGDEVPTGFIEVGDLVPYLASNPTFKNVIHPLVALGIKQPKEVKQKFVAAHYKSLGVVYK